MKTLKFLLAARLKHSSKSARISGFTLIELLVGLILAFLIITPLLGFVVDTLNTDHQEQAKTNSEQELQSALEYISRDLQQAVYIYNADSLDNSSNPNAVAPAKSGIKDQLPTFPNAVPVLVFWKRKLVEKSAPNGTSGACPLSPQNAKCSDAFVYSLVAYYLTNNPDANWSGTTRIGRWEIHDGVKDATGNDVYPTNDPRHTSQGFAQFSIAQGDIPTSLNSWQRSGGYDQTNVPEPLIDYIDQSLASTVSQTEACPLNDPNNTDTTQWQQVPSAATLNANTALNTKSFYTCVYSKLNTAKIFLRGNALARINNKTNPPTYSQAKSSFFPTAKIEVKSTGGLGGSNQ